MSNKKDKELDLKESDLAEIHTTIEQIQTNKQRRRAWQDFLKNPHIALTKAEREDLQKAFLEGRGQERLAELTRARMPQGELRFKKDEPAEKRLVRRDDDDPEDPYSEPFGNRPGSYERPKKR